MDKKEIEHVFQTTGTIVRGHFVLKSRGVDDDFAGIEGAGDHSDLYVNKDAIFPPPIHLRSFCNHIAAHLRADNIHIDLVTAPAVGAIGQLVYLRDALYEMQGVPVFGIYSEEDADGKRIFKRGFGAFLTKHALVAEDITTTGATCKKVIEAVRAGGGEVVAATVLCNRGGITAEDLGVPYLFSFYEMEGAKKWLLEECPLCKEGVPVSTELGKGKLFLKNKADLPVSQE